MKAIILSLLMALSCEAKELVWSDEFNTSQLDQTKWNIIEGQRHSATNTCEAISVKDGSLRIRTFTEHGKHYTGMVDTEGKFETAYGYWEMRVKFDDQPGTWSDAWLYAQSVTQGFGDINKYGQEIDIFEHRKFDMNNKDISGVVNHVVHWDGYGEHHKGVGTDKPIKKGEWNVIGFEWTPTAYKWFINGEETFTVSPTTSKPLFFIFSTEVGYLDFWTQPIPKEGYDHTTLMVDYVRFYR